MHAAVIDRIVPVEVDNGVDAAADTGPGDAQVQFGSADQPEFEDHLGGINPFGVQVVQIETVKNHPRVAIAAVGVALEPEGIVADRMQVDGEAEADFDGNRQRPPNRENLQVLEIHAERGQGVIDQNRVAPEQHPDALETVGQDRQAEVVGEFTVSEAA